MSRPPSVLITRRGRVLVLTINRPEARNAVDVDVATLIGTALHEADGDPAVAAVVLTGAGTTFCAGADLKAVARGEALRPQDPAGHAWGFAGYTTHPISKPLIAAVNGPAVGGGCELVLASDLAVASRTAYLQLPEVPRGIFPAAGGAVRLPRQLPPRVASELLLTGRRIDAASASRRGLVNAVVEPAGVLDSAVRYGEAIAAQPAAAVAAVLRLARAAPHPTLPDEARAWRLSEHEWQRLVAPRSR